ncbi:hypothetical protein O3P69_006886 [Scylla paramamosain]|uniref:Secreted protein n=1 Tax=Scylla paramamosain TaxID=85552 RepID=A0AAW0U4K8_SCYPA
MLPLNVLVAPDGGGGGGGDGMFVVVVVVVVMRRPSHRRIRPSGRALRGSAGCLGSTSCLPRCSGRKGRRLKIVRTAIPPVSRLCHHLSLSPPITSAIIAASRHCQSPSALCMKE